MVMGTTAVHKFPPSIDVRGNNGLNMIFVPDHEQEGLIVALYMPVGKLFDPSDFEGLCELTVALMEKGTASHTPEEFSLHFEQHGSSLFADVSDEYCIVGCKMLSRFAKTTIPLFWEMVTAPSFLDTELARIKREMLTALQAELSEPGALAARGFAKQLYGPEHPAGKIRSTSSIKNISVSRIKQFYGSRFSPQGATLVMVGDFENSSLEQWQSLFESWTPAASPQTLNLPAIVNRTEKQVQLIDKPDLTQATLLIGHPVVGELSEERNALALANYILGGGNFSSRLMAQIRSKLGKTYGISSQTSFGRLQGTFAISTATQSAQLTEMLQAIFSVYSQFSSQGVSAEELLKAQQYTIGSISFQLEGIGAVAEKLLWLAMYNRPRSYLEEFAAMINAITLRRINEVIERNFGCEYPAFVVVGNKSQTISQLSCFGRVECESFRKGL